MKIGSLNNTFIPYAYIENRDYKIFKDRFTRNTHIALDFLVKTNILTLPFEDNGIEEKIDIIDVLVADTSNNITIVPGNRNAYNHRLNSIMFQDTHGVIFRKNHRKSWFRRNKGYNSAVALLSHELIHCYNELYDNEDYLSRKSDHSHRGQKLDLDGNDLSFPNAEEAFVIKMTNLVAKRLGEDKRSNYGRSYYPTQGVLTTKRRRKK